jgi:hypothetical protein
MPVWQLLQGSNTLSLFTILSVRKHTQSSKSPLFSICHYSGNVFSCQPTEQNYLLIAFFWKKVYTEIISDKRRLIFY